VGGGKMESDPLFNDGNILSNYVWALALTGSR